MAQPTNDLESRLLNLAVEERARLAEVLLASLDDDADYAAAWLEEVRRRSAELRSGAVQGIPSADALAAARAQLR